MKVYLAEICLFLLQIIYSMRTQNVWQTSLALVSLTENCACVIKALLLECSVKILEVIHVFKAKKSSVTHYLHLLIRNLFSFRIL